MFSDFSFKIFHFKIFTLFFSIFSFVFHTLFAPKEALDLDSCRCKGCVEEDAMIRAYYASVGVRLTEAPKKYSCFECLTNFSMIIVYIVVVAIFILLVFIILKALNLTETENRLFSVEEQT